MKNINQLKLFIGHKPPAFGVWPEFTYCSQNEGNFQLPQDALLDQISDKILSEYHSLFLLRRKLLVLGIVDGTITICQHRRFVLNSPLGVVAANQPFARVIDPTTAAQINTQLLAPKSGAYLIGTPLTVGGTLLDQYHVHHPIRDLLRFLSDLVDANLLDSSDAHNILNARFFIPAPACGVFPVIAFHAIFELLEQCALAWQAGGFVAREAYQGRSSSFLLERLNSYLLTQFLEGAGINFKQVVGYTTLVSDGNVVQPG
jgi:hypothetical protein